MRKLLNLLVLLTLSGPAFSQMLVGTDTLYGNEWINYDQSYYKIPVSKDGLYRLNAETLQQAGIVLSELSGDRLRLYHMGQEVPIHISSTGSIATGDYLLFWGEQNRGEFDTHLFEDPEENQLNPLYSLVTDTSAYYLTWGDAPSSTRLQTVDSDLTNPPAKEEWIWQQAEEVFTEKFMKNYTRRSGITIYFSHYDVAEGYGNRNINELLQSGSTTQDFSLDLPDAYIGGPSARFTARFGVGEGDHRQLVQIDGGTYFERSYNDISVKAPDFSFPLTDDDIDIHFEGQADDRDEQSIAFYQVDYPSLPDARNQKIFQFEVEASNSTKYLEIADFNSSAGIPVIYDLSNGLRILCSYENGMVKAILPPSTEQRSLVLLEEASAEVLDAPQSTNFPNLLSQTTDFLILTAPELRETYENQDQVQAYADYRSSAAGGNYKTQVVEVEDIYHEFGYGLDRHPQSIRNFVHAANRQWPNLKYVFIIGKGREYPSLRLASGLASAIEAETFFVPSFGFPASDNLMLSNNSSSVAVVPVGRIAATTPKEISIYLRKVETLEATVNNGQTIEERAWMKNIIHLGGGGSSGEQNAIKSNLERIGQKVEDGLFGGKINAFYKTSVDPIQFSVTDLIFDRINRGAAMITFFGHSSPGSFDFSIDDPENYKNAGRYPFIMSLGCYSGNFFTASKGIGERFSFLDDKAAVAFGASRGVGFISTLGGFADEFYKNLGTAAYGQGLGDIVEMTRARFDYLSGLEIKTIVQQFAIHGDPSIRLHPQQGPDYVVDKSSIEFSPQVVSAQEDSFDIEFTILNLGLYVQDSMNVLVQQHLPNGKVVSQKARVSAPAYESKIKLTLPIAGKEVVGLNNFYLEVDVDEEISELPMGQAENNNSTGTDDQDAIKLFIVDNTAKPVYPAPFSIVSGENVELLSSTTDALAPERKYILELDTSLTFNSPFTKRFSTTQKGGLIKWSPAIDFQDAYTYYWRISPDSTDSDLGFVWESSSFTYLSEAPKGWAQNHYWQWLEGEPEGLEVNADRSFQFLAEPISVKIRNKFLDPIDRPGLSYNNGHAAASVQPWRFLSEGVAVVVSNPVTAGFWRNQSGEGPFEEGEYGVSTGRSRVFAFPTATQAERANLMNFLTDVVPTDYFVFVFTIITDENAEIYADRWAADSTVVEGNLFSVLEAEGAKFVRQLEDFGSVPYVYMYQKGGGGLAEDIAPEKSEEVLVDINIPRFDSNGQYWSPKLGPATQWTRLSWKGANVESETDSIYLKLIAFDKSGNSQTLLGQITEEELDLSFIDGEAFPELQLVYYASDLHDRSPTQLQYWRVFYEGIPEAALNTATALEGVVDTLRRGEQINLDIAYENLTNYPMDSLLIRYSVRDQNNNEEETLV
ncbi:MAG: hypothetical protein F6K19_21555, partial [Cyanothece sp. SIO1E1]|nr:hypothetical protein [Cyanothece sp. SIO1E1]